MIGGWINYYGRCRPWELDRIPARISTCLVRGIRNKYKRLAARTRAYSKMQEVAQRYPRMFVHRPLTAAAAKV